VQGGKEKPDIAILAFRCNAIMAQ